MKLTNCFIIQRQTERERVCVCERVSLQLLWGSVASVDFSTLVCYVLHIRRIDGVKKYILKVTKPLASSSYIRLQYKIMSY